MPEREVVEQLAEVRSRLECVFRLLDHPSPEALARCEALLGEAVDRFEDSRALWRLAQGNPEALAEARCVRTKIRQAGRLLGNAAAYYQGWYRVLATRAAGYTARGTPGALIGGNRISLQG